MADNAGAANNEVTNYAETLTSSLINHLIYSIS